MEEPNKKRKFLEPNINSVIDNLLTSAKEEEKEKKENLLKEEINEAKHRVAIAQRKLDKLEIQKLIDERKKHLYALQKCDKQLKAVGINPFEELNPEKKIFKKKHIYNYESYEIVLQNPKVVFTRVIDNRIICYYSAKLGTIMFSMEKHKDIRATDLYSKIISTNKYVEDYGVIAYGSEDIKFVEKHNLFKILRLPNGPLKIYDTNAVQVINDKIVRNNEINNNIVYLFLKAQFILNNI